LTTYKYYYKEIQGGKTEEIQSTLKTLTVVNLKGTSLRTVEVKFMKYSGGSRNFWMEGYSNLCQP
jgi:hypothetical protein